MDVHKLSHPDDPELLKQLLLEQQQNFCRQQYNAQKMINQQQKLIDRVEKSNDTHTLQERLVKHRTRIQILEEQLMLLRAHQFGKRSAKHANPDQIQLFNEAEVLADEAVSSDTETDNDDIDVPAHMHKRRCSQAILEDLARVDVLHDLEDDEKQCSACGEAMAPLTKRSASSYV